MSHSAPIDIDGKSPPFDQFRSIHRLAAARSGHASAEHARHQLYVARDNRSRANVLIKATSKPGLVYEQELTNEIATLSTNTWMSRECGAFVRANVTTNQPRALPLISRCPASRGSCVKATQTTDIGRCVDTDVPDLQAMKVGQRLGDLDRRPEIGNLPGRDPFRADGGGQWPLVKARHGQIDAAVAQASMFTQGTGKYRESGSSRLMAFAPRLPADVLDVSAPSEAKEYPLLDYIKTARIE